MDLAVPVESAAERLDLFLRTHCPQHSRSSIQALIKAGAIRVNGQKTRPAYLVQPGDAIAVELPAPEPSAARPEPLPLSIAYEDDDLLVVNKAAGMTVHPAPGATEGTLVNALLHHGRDLSGINGALRPGIVHRLDKETSGLLLVAKRDAAHRTLAASLQAHQIERCYAALVWGVLREENGQIEAPIGRHPKNRKKMAVIADGRAAATNFKVAERFPFTSLAECQLETGRTHQIRVHLAHIGHPVFGDPVYGGRDQARGVRPEYRRQANWMLSLIKRQALHAKKLRFAHPTTGEMMEFTAPLPEDFQAALEAARMENG
ncbi:MAG: RluA family pseudouridine synthase [Gemmatimonadetes bacterium]|nr:RluA family pseudouridine synthase [Gemmatimonadota bacterium]MXY81864.1 RluA family pseudouridine synthase [Gemmatimonadota bacterium]MYB71110.1 RluA family pseudouridine synthase [Gemmatimonadota bacterium]